jgi:hypothetical protein
MLRVIRMTVLVVWHSLIFEIVTVHVHHEDERVRTQEARVNQCGCSRPKRLALFHYL